jgi:hypothetical protein
MRVQAEYQLGLSDGRRGCRCFENMVDHPFSQFLLVAWVAGRPSRLHDSR